MEGWHPLWLRYLPGVPPHLFFEVLAVVVGLGLALRRRKARSKSPVPVTVSALVGAVLGARVLGLLVDPSETWSLRASLGGWMQKQTVVGGILGGWAAVEVAKHRLGIRRSTADSFVLPLMVALSVGRLGCFFSGVTDRTHGRPWTGPFAMDLGDGVLRHPLALYEVIVVMANVADESQRQLGEQLYADLQAAGVDVLLDDRSERAGVKFKDADVLGIPWRVVVGRGAAEGQVELVQRAGGLKQDLAATALLPLVLEQLQRERQGLLAA